MARICVEARLWAAAERLNGRVDVWQRLTERAKRPGSEQSDEFYRLNRRLHWAMGAAIRVMTAAHREEFARD